MLSAAEAYAEFEQWVQTESAARNLLFYLLMDAGLIACKSCGDKDVRRCGDNDRLVICRKCRNATYFTAGTFFHSAKKIKPILGALYLVSRGYIMSASSLAKIVGVSFATAWGIFSKIDQVLIEDWLHHFTVVSVRVFGAVIHKRSRLSLPKLHPRAEFDFQDDEQSDEEEPPFEMRVTENPAADTVSEAPRKEAEAILEALAEGPQRIEQIADATGLDASVLYLHLLQLQLDGSIEEKAMNVWQLCRRTEAQSLTKEDRSAATECMQYLRRVFRGTSKKYFAGFAARYWFKFDWQYWTPERFGRKILRHAPVPLRQILSFDTGPTVPLPVISVQSPIDQRPSLPPTARDLEVTFLLTCSEK